MATIAPPRPVVGAARQQLPYGLFSVLPWRADADGHWQLGVTWEPGTCEPVNGIGSAQCVEETIGLPKELDRNLPEQGEASPFTVYGWFNCTPVGYSPADGQALADQHLLAREEARVEQAFWTGDLGNIPNLAGANGYPEPIVLKATPVDVRTAVGSLESFIGSTYGSLGVIHMGRTVATLAIARGVADYRGGRLYTELGTPIVVGAGYPGTGPDGTAPANALWIYATPALFGYRSETFNSSARPGDLLDRRTNDLYAIAERTYLIGFDPCGVGAALVGLPATPASQGGDPDPDPDPTPLVMTLGSIPSSPIPDGTDVTAVVQTNQPITDDIHIWYSLNGGPDTDAGTATQVDTLEFVFNADESITVTGDSVEVWATTTFDGSPVESNHITIQVT